MTDDKIEGLTADLRCAVQVAWRRGAKDWARLNYPQWVEWLESCDASVQQPADGEGVMSMVHSGQGAVTPTCDEVWTVGQHPAMLRGWIVRPVLFGSRVRVLPEHEGGHVVIKSEEDARLIAAAPDMLAALISTRDSLQAMADEGIVAGGSWPTIDAAIAKATTPPVKTGEG